MPTFVALLRGINVGGRRSLKMADLRTAIEAAGGENVVTYIQSGNVVFDHPVRTASGVLQVVEPAIASAAGFAVPTVVRTVAEWKKVIEANPFAAKDHPKVHVTFFAAPVAAAKLRGVDAEAFAPETFVAAKREVYLHLPNGMGRSKLAAALARALPDGTTRNLKTVLELRDLAVSR